VTEFENWASSPRAITLDESLAFEAPLLKEACEMWTAVAKGAIPPRSAFSARLVKNFVGNLIIFERLDADDYLIRLMGTRVSNMLGEMQGQTLRQGLPADAEERWKLALNAVRASRKPLRIVTLVNINDLQFLEAELFLAPLCDDTGQETMVFTVAVFRSGVAKSRSVDDLVIKN
jgi:hypothetical protein